MHGQFIIKKIWLSAFSYAQSFISLVFCRSFGSLVPLLCMEKKVGGGGGGHFFFFLKKKYINYKFKNNIFLQF
jgi:hypothetical protein